MAENTASYQLKSKPRIKWTKWLMHHLDLDPHEIQVLIPRQPLLPNAHLEKPRSQSVLLPNPLASHELLRLVLALANLALNLLLSLVAKIY
jgi:hypothetical protein